MKHIVLYAALAVVAGLAFANLYNSVVDVPTWQRDVPLSVQQARDYFRSANPGNFYRVFSPVAQILLLTSVVLFWKQGKGTRMALVAALVLAVVADAFTFGYFYPRNAILFTPTSDIGSPLIIASVNEWARMNWLRTAVVLASFTSAAVGLHRSYAIPSFR